MEKIAIVVDSATDVTDYIRGDHNIFRIPLQINIGDKSYTDGVDITGEEVFQAMETSKVSSSLPGGEVIEKLFNDIKEQGYTHAIVVTITSAMSGTYNVIRNFAEAFEGMKIAVIDTLRISVGAGYVAVRASEKLEAGYTFDEILKDIEDTKLNANVFFTLSTLDYLIKGGRIGAVAGTVANVLNLRPVISVSDEGVYYTCAKARGYQKAITKTIDAAYDYVKDLDKYRVVLLHADSKMDFAKIMAYAKSKFDKAEEISIEKISVALSTHSGREGFGVGVSRV